MENRKIETTYQIKSKIIIVDIKKFIYSNQNNKFLIKIIDL